MDDRFEILVRNDKEMKLISFHFENKIFSKLTFIWPEISIIYYYSFGIQFIEFLSLLLKFGKIGEIDQLQFSTNIIPITDLSFQLLFKHIFENVYMLV